MKKSTYVTVLLLLIVQIAFSQETHKRVKVATNASIITKLDHIGIDLSCGAVFNGNDVELELSEQELAALTNEGISYNVIINDLESFYRERAINDLPKARIALEKEKAYAKSMNRSSSVNALIENIGQYTGCDEIDWKVPQNWNLNPNASPNSFGGCLTYDMVLQELDDMKALYPNLISTRKNASPTNQKTIEGRTVWVVRISDNPEVDEADEPETLYQALIHSRESATVMNQLFFMWYLLENYDSDPAIKNLVNNQALYFIPVFNPDGFVYNQTIEPDGGGLQRKNRNVGTNSCGTTTNGIDLNRNSAYFWGNGGASASLCSETYRGTGPFSENETQIMRDFFLEHDFKLALNHHSYKNSMLHAYAGVNQANPRPDEYSKYNHDMTRYNRYGYGPSTQITSLNSGNMNDWMLGGPAGVSSESGTPSGTGSGKHTLAWTPENGGLGEAGSTGSGFWPSPSNFLPIARRAMRMNLLAAYFSGKYAKIHDLTKSDITALTGDLTFGLERLGQTDGSFTVTVTPISSNLLSVGSAVTESFVSGANPNYPATETNPIKVTLEQRDVNISYTLSPTIQPNDLIQYKVTLTNDYASDNVLYEANITKIYNPTMLFNDNPDVDNLTNWTASGGSWFVTNDAYSGTSAITTTATAPYGNSINKTLQMDGTVNLNGNAATIIQFYGKWDLERSFDYVQIEASTNGSSWTPLCGNLTKPGQYQDRDQYSQKSTDNFQPRDEPLYDGDTQGKWNLEEIVIDEHNNAAFHNQSTVYLRFQFRTDSNGNRQDSYINANFEGFTFDDFKVVEVPCSTTVPTSLAASNITTNSVELNWDNVFAGTYDVRYREVGTATWTNISNLSDHTTEITTLEPATQYETQVRSECSGGGSSAYSSAITFTTLNCDTPVNVTTSNLTSSSVRIAWDETPSATYTLRYREVGAPSWSTISDIATPYYNISGLEKSTDYEAQVRAICSASVNSSFSVSTNFTTLECDEYITSYPYTESFETNLGDWTQASINEIDWTRFSGLTPSNTGGNSPNTTGPSTASDGSYYLYTESSGSNNNKNAYLVSPCFNLGGFQNAQLEFDYHMFGATMGTLTIEISTDNGDSYATLFTRSGDHPSQNANNDPWITVTEDLSLYDGQTIKLRFHGVTGTDYRSDISIDNIKLTANNVLSTDKNITLENVLITPNPFNSGITIKLPLAYHNNMFNVKIFDLNGRIVHNNNYNNSNGSVKVTGLDKLEQAPYILKITNSTNGETTIKRLIKY